MKVSDVLPEVGRSVAYYPRLAKAVGGVKPGLLLCQLIYWVGKGKSPNGWIYKSQEELKLETGLSRREQESARKTLRKLGVLQERYARLEHRLYFRVDLEALRAHWTTINVSANVNSSKANKSIRECANAPSGEEQNRRSPDAMLDTPLTESTAQNTAIENNTEKVSKESKAMDTTGVHDLACFTSLQGSSIVVKGQESRFIQEQPLFNALCGLCDIEYSHLNEDKRQEFAQAIVKLQRVGISSLELTHYARKWKQNWRYQESGGRAPQPSEVSDLWSEVMGRQFARFKPNSQT